MANGTGASVPGYYPFHEFAHCIKHGKGMSAGKTEETGKQGDEGVSPTIGESPASTEEAWPMR